jgi:ribonuclease Z
MSKGMKAVILGSGSAVPDPERGNPSQAVIIDDAILLFDCGERTTVNLVKAGINPMEVDCLFFTHLHWDHMCDYGYLVMTTWNCGRSKTLEVFGPAGTREMSDATIFGAHKADVDFVRGYIKALPPHIKSKPRESPAVHVEDIESGFVYSGEGFKVIAGDVEHLQRVGMPSVGYRIESPHGAVAISGDTRPCEGMIELARGADVLIHDTAFLDEIIEERQMWSHSGPSGAGRVAQEARVKKLVLTHLGPYTSAQAAVDMASMYYGGRRSPDIWDKIVEAAKKNYSGPVVLAHDAMVIDIGSDKR